MDITIEVTMSFRAWYREFADEDKYPVALLARSLDIAQSFINVSRWGTYDFKIIDDIPKATRYAQGLFAYAAHLMVIDAQARESLEMGELPSAVASVSGKSVGDESESYARAAPNLGEESLTATSYGQCFLALKRTVTTLGCIV